MLDRYLTQYVIGLNGVGFMKDILDPTVSLGEVGVMKNIFMKEVGVVWLTSWHGGRR